jgi:PhnB protein
MITNGNQTVVQPYLFFDGRCEEAVAFYTTHLGAKVEFLMRYKDSPDKSTCAPNADDKVMHCSFRIGESMLMGSDGECKGRTEFKGFSLSLAVPTEADADRVFAALSQGGQVQVPLTKTFFSARFGMVADKFGVGWMVMVAQAPK